MQFQYKAGKGAVKVEFIPGSLSLFDSKTLSVGYGKIKGDTFLNRREFVLVMRKVVATAKANKVKSIAVTYADFKALAPKSMGDYEAGRVAGTAFAMAGYEIGRAH